MMCHGDSDPIVPLRWGEQSAALLKKFNKLVEFRTYKNLAHSSSDEVNQYVKNTSETLFYLFKLQEMRDLQAFLMRTIPTL
jgi:lysophospholipase-2